MSVFCFEKEKNKHTEDSSLLPYLEYGVSSTGKF